MINLLKPMTLMLFLMFVSCNSTKNPKTENDAATEKAKKMIADGFKKGIIIAFDKKSNCPYIIKLQKSNQTAFLDPVDLPAKFKEDKMAIWFKFTPSRRIKRCQKANPVLLNDEIHLRN
ncbi:hypothetical protein [Mesohalobacter halotolerans]|uniref:Uncharacterized protein n=1 Tax=Mesohalobacter halotolerans TaxID=1883405 RepID=A0A4U5TRD6_9FLAO|nr:hypothetical protein [Mesohalobacter halotolerans]MBS3739361.1 hypothetical protein [Psychroflexus sp.]TKS56810.1 hypothetical protein FCN74_07230 [Mesohalobacter halotolerans]